ncbi:MAG: DNA-binding transcriptional regulator YiaG [Natronomonas sp.]|jgi:DNA-binding transcriptional regulator YiaG
MATPRIRPTAESPVTCWTCGFPILPGEGREPLHTAQGTKTQHQWCGEVPPPERLGDIKAGDVLAVTHGSRALLAQVDEVFTLGHELSLFLETLDDGEWRVTTSVGREGWHEPVLVRERRRNQTDGTLRLANPAFPSITDAPLELSPAIAERVAKQSFADAEAVAGTQFRAVREDRGVMQTAVAAAVSIPQGTLSLWERGQSAAPTEQQVAVLTAWVTDGETVRDLRALALAAGL